MPHFISLFTFFSRFFCCTLLSIFLPFQPPSIHCRYVRCDRLLHFFFAEWARVGRPAKVTLGSRDQARHPFGMCVPKNDHCSFHDVSRVTSDSYNVAVCHNLELRLDLGCGRGSMIERWLGFHPPSFACIDKLPGNSTADDDFWRFPVDLNHLES